MCQEWGVKKGGTLGTLRVPDQRHGIWDHPWCHGWCFFTLGKIPWTFHVDIFIRSVSGMGFLIGVIEDRVILDGWCFFTLGKIPWKFCVDIFIISVSGIGGEEGEYLEDNEGSWRKTWRTGSSLMLYMILFYPKEDTLKVLCWYLYYKCVRNWDARRGHFEDIEGSWSKTWWLGSSLTSWMIFFHHREDTLKVLCWHLYYECVRNWSQEWQRAWRILRGPDQRLGGQSHPWQYGCTW